MGSSATSVVMRSARSGVMPHLRFAATCGSAPASCIESVSCLWSDLFLRYAPKE